MRGTHLDLGWTSVRLWRTHFRSHHRHHLLQQTRLVINTMMMNIRQSYDLCHFTFTQHKCFRPERPIMARNQAHQSSPRGQRVKGRTCFACVHAHYIYWSVVLLLLLCFILCFTDAELNPFGSCLKCVAGTPKSKWRKTREKKNIE